MTTCVQSLAYAHAHTELYCVCVWGGGQRVGSRSQGAAWVPVAHLDWPVVVLGDRLRLDVGLHLPIQEVLGKLAHGSRTVERVGEKREGRRGEGRRGGGEEGRGEGGGRWQERDE